MFNPLTNKHNKTIFVDGNGVVCTKSSAEIMSLLFQDIPVVLRLHTVDDWIFATPNYWDASETVLWFSYVDGTTNLTNLVGIDRNAEIVYYTGE